MLTSHQIGGPQAYTSESVSAAFLSKLTLTLTLFKFCVHATGK